MQLVGGGGPHMRATSGGPTRPPDVAPMSVGWFGVLSLVGLGLFGSFYVVVWRV